MAVHISVGGSEGGDGFLLAPLGTTYDAELALWTDSGTAAVTLQASPNNANLVFSQTSVNISTAPTVITVHAMTQSTSRGDTTIQVLDGPSVVASFTITCIKHPKVHFRGRFEARFATDGALYNVNPIYTDVIDTVVPPGWTWGLEGEPNFVPTMGNIPENLETPVGRVVRLNNPAALRSHAAPVVSTVAAISGQTTAGTETFVTGDPLIGQPVDFGSGTYLAGNNAFAAPAPEEYFSAAFEPMALFEIHFGNLFGGASQVGPFTHKATFENEKTRMPDSRPIASGLVGASAELAEFGLPNLQTFSETRIDQLVADFNALPAGNTPERRNLARRIGHLLSSVSSAKRTAVMNANPGAFTIRAGTLTQGWPNKEVYGGMVDTNLAFNPGASSVVTYMSEFNLFKFEGHYFGFHSDELCGHHKGSLTPHRLVNGTYVGDPHTHTVDGTNYDFQAVGEFTVLRDGETLEVQARQTPVETQNPITDGYSGLTSCVSINTAVAARLGTHRVSLQPGREAKRLQFYVDGKPAPLPFEAIDLGGHSVVAFDVAGETGIRIDYPDETVVIFTPLYWNAYNVWYIDISVSNTQADEGLMGDIPQGSWLPRLRGGESVGPMPASLQDRYDMLYKKFADSWRITDATSLFVYEPGTSTKTFTDPDWPAEKPPCKVKPEFQIPGAPKLEGMPVEKAEEICRTVIMEDLHKNCVFDVATTGDPDFARGYFVAQELRLYGTTIKIVTEEPPTQPSRVPTVTPDERPYRLDHSLVVTATVSPLDASRPTPTGSVTFIIDGVPMDRPVELDEQGRAQITIARLKPEEQSLRGKRGRRRRITATYAGGGKYDYRASRSATLMFQEAARPTSKARR